MANQEGGMNKQLGQESSQGQGGQGSGYQWGQGFGSGFGSGFQGESRVSYPSLCVAYLLCDLQCVHMQNVAMLVCADTVPFTSPVLPSLALTVVCIVSALHCC